jgi:hypothetical protein
MTTVIAERLRRRLAPGWIVGALLLVLALAAVCNEFQSPARIRYGAAATIDLIAYWGGGRLLWAGTQPYDLEKLCDLQLRASGHPSGCAPGCHHPPFPVIMYNPPWLSVWLAPIAVLPFPSAVAAWLLLNIALTLIAATLIWKTCDHQSFPVPASVAWVAALAYMPTLSNLQMGQMGGLLIVGLAGFLYAVARGRELTAGMFLALTTIKPHVVYLPWIAVIWWVVSERRWRVAAGVIAVLLPSLAVIGFVCPRALIAYQTVLAQPPLHLRTPTIGGIARLYLFAEVPRIQYLPALLAGSCLLVYLAVVRPVIDWKQALGPLLLVSVPTAAYGWSYDQVVLLVPYLDIVSKATGTPALEAGRRRALLASLVAITLVMAAQNRLNVSDDAYFWAPWAVAGVYLGARLCGELKGREAPRTAFDRS